MLLRCSNVEIGRYRIVRTLGRGGTAEVLEAQAEGAGGFTRRVAIKRLLPEHASEPAYARMFLDEARIASALHHANIVSVIDYGIADGRPFQVLQYVDGIDAGRLADRARAREKSLPVALVLHVCTEIAHALHHAHTALGDDGTSLGVVHRDVSPANILVSWGGEVHLADFGIAFAKDRSERTADGISKGTPLYCAPEQLTGGRVDARTDVFSLAATCHRLLCGKSPLAGEHVVADLLAGKPLTIDASIDEDIAAILRRALAPDRSARQADAAELASALGTALARRLDNDPRTILRGFLDEIREVSPPPSRGKLDALLGMGLELVVVGEHDGVRSYESRTTQVTAIDKPAETPAPRSRIPLALVLASMLALGAVTLTLLWPRDEARRLDHIAKLSPIDPPRRGEPRRDEPARVDPLHVDPPVAPPPEPAPAAKTDARPKRPSPARPIAVGEPPPTGTGIVAIGGELAVKAEIRVDGKSKGHAPKRVELSIGTHDIALYDASGTKLASKRVEVTPRHTRFSPLRWELAD